MSFRQTQRERDAEIKEYLRQRLPHNWQDGDVCATCRAKLTPTRRAAACKGRRRPNRWRMHFNRQRSRSDSSQRKPFVYDGPTILALMAECVTEAKRWPASDDRYWKYMPAARRYRRLMSQWWALPSREATLALHAEHEADRQSDCGLTAKRNKLIKRVHASGERVVRDGNCEYRFYDGASAVINKVWMPLFKDSAA